MCLRWRGVVALAQAEAGPLAAAELASEAVSAEDFVSETTRTLVEAKQAQAALGADIERADKELRYVQVISPCGHRRAQYARVRPSACGQAARRVHRVRWRCGACAQKHQPEVLSKPEAQQHLAQLAHARRVHAQRAVALSQLQDVLLMARQAMAVQGSSPLAEDEDEDEEAAEEIEGGEEVEAGGARAGAPA